MRRPFAPGLADDADVLSFAAEEIAAGRRAAVATIVSLDGPFSRPLGAQISIAEDGRHVGSVSGGCLETALAGEALRAMAEGRNAAVRYGRGSRFIDVRLPCGGGIDLHIDVDPPRDELVRAIDLYRARTAFVMAIDTRSERPRWKIMAAAGASEDGLFYRRYRPRTRIVMAGRGWEIVALARHACEAGLDVVVASQEEATLEYCSAYTTSLITLTTPTAVPPFPIDRFTAVACLFHEREWEAGFLLDALASEAFYIGALGSRQAHLQRVETLSELGAGPEDIARLHAPIGRFTSRNPNRLAISALAEILELDSEG
jgi:xanthine dehydrogenase accessory factor